MKPVPEIAESPRVFAAGVVALRGSGNLREALVVHRPDRNDWSLPKGKVDPGERLAATAVRETLEETGVAVTLGVPLETVQYPVLSPRGRLTAEKTVHYWQGRVLDPAIAAGDVDVPAHWQANQEIGEVRWVRVKKLRGLLTYPHDVDVVMEAAEQPTNTSPFIIARHAQAEKRGDFRARMGEELADTERPLTPRGHAQAQALTAVFAAYGIHAVASSSAVRCMDTMRPYAGALGVEVTAIDAITEEAFALQPKQGVAAVLAQLHRAEPAVMCIHRPTRKRLMRAIAEETEQLVDFALAPAEYIVFHRAVKRRDDGRIAKVRLGDSTIIEYGRHHEAQPRDPD